MFKILEQIWLENDRIQDIIAGTNIFYLKVDGVLITTALKSLQNLTSSLNKFIKISTKNKYFVQPITKKKNLNVDLFSCNTKIISIQIFNYLDDDILIKYFCSFASKILPFSYIEPVQGPNLTNNILGNFISPCELPYFEFEIIKQKILENFPVIQEGDHFCVHLYE